ncbi:hypothetical protein ACRALDRAFT_2101419, partial [Sodiomyces alcalophilus JCM 7366]|uniref:uncharacterized protein n=1 Tax=Sodiomyces alcalophilus JCM 7366 TaxID=591952 RepID=UPI0039B45F60
VEVLLIIHEAMRYKDFSLLRDIIPYKSWKYSLEIMYFSWLLYPDISDKHISDAILKGGLIRYLTASDGYKAINLLIEHVNALYTLDIKYNKNSMHDISSTFKRLALNSNYIAIIQKAVESFLGTKQKGTYSYR